MFKYSTYTITLWQTTKWEVKITYLNSAFSIINSTPTLHSTLQLGKKPLKKIYRLHALVNIYYFINIYYKIYPAYT